MKKNKCVSCKLTLVTGIVFVITSTNNFPFLWKKKTKNKKNLLKVSSFIRHFLVSSDIFWFSAMTSHTHIALNTYIHIHLPPPSYVQYFGGQCLRKLFQRVVRRTLFVNKYDWYQWTIPYQSTFHLN